jgi:hypothetical protein
VRCKSQLKNAEQSFNAEPLGQPDAEPQSEHGAERQGFVAGVELVFRLPGTAAWFLIKINNTN